MTVNTRIFDARNRFLRKGREIPRPEHEQGAADRAQSQQLEAQGLRDEFKRAPKFNEQDRKTLVRNLGRLIERKFPDDFRRVAGEVLRTAFGEEGGLSAEKKRKRYIRFDGERMPDHQPGEYLANRMQFQQIINALADRFHGASISALQREQILLSVCDGTSFYGQTRPRLFKEMDLPDQFRERMQEMIDHIARDTDIVAYLDEVRHYNIETHPRGKSDCTEEVLNNLHQQCFPVEQFVHVPHGLNNGTSYAEYSRLHLRGYDIRAEAPSALYPRIRLARIYWPRQVLCLKLGVPALALHDIRNRPLGAPALAEALRNHDPDPSETKGAQERDAIESWRRCKERELRDSALRSAGHDPATMDWKALENPLDREAVDGAEWRTFWQTSNVDLHLVAEDVPEALRLGLSIYDLDDRDWTDAPKELLTPTDDAIPGSDIQCTYTDEPEDYFAWFPASKWSRSGEKTDEMLVCRGFKRDHNVALPPDANGVVETESICDEFEDYTPELLQQFRLAAKSYDKLIFPPTGKGAWDLLTLPMADWQDQHFDLGSSHHRDEAPPSLRPLFTAPNGWTPAPDGTLASAILRSLAYGEGDERLDMKLKQSVNARVACLRHMKDELARTYNASLAKHGYGDESTDA